MSDEEFEECVRRFGKMDSDPSIVQRFRKVLEESHEDAEEISKGDLFTAWLKAYVLERYYPQQ